MKHFIFIPILIILFSCQSKPKQTQDGTQKANSIKIYKRNLKANTRFLTYNKYGIEDIEGNGVQIDGNIVAIPFDAAKEASSVRIKYLGADIEPMARGFVWYDITHNLLFLRVSGREREHLKLSIKPLSEPLYGLKLHEGKLRKYAIKIDSCIELKTYKFSTTKSSYAEIGSAVYNKDHEIAGLILNMQIDNKTHKAIYPSNRLKSILDTIPRKIRSVSALRFKTDKIYPEPSTIDYFSIETSFGNIGIRLSDKLPEYQKNFIRLCSDGYYDSLLVHRVIRNFLIQMGAADTKHAKKDDPVGWKGPGYTLPTKIVPGLFHKRGAVAASKLPSFHNDKNRSDGSQFYIISGRKFNNEELDELEKQKNITFSKYQREIYNTLGGAPYLDGDYTVFAEVIKGMHIVDSIAAVATKSDERPMKDIRIRTIRMVEK